jgi:hypothetical protein
LFGTFLHVFATGRNLVGDTVLSEIYTNTPPTRFARSLGTEVSVPVTSRDGLSAPGMGVDPQVYVGGIGAALAGPAKGAIIAAANTNTLRTRKYNFIINSLVYFPAA